MATIIVKDTGHKNVKTFHVDTELSRRTVTLARSNVGNPELKKHFRKEIVSLIENILSINGTTGMIVDYYAFTVEIGEAFGWEDILPAIIFELSTLFDEPPIVGYGEQVGIFNPYPSASELISTIISAL